jgi:hypothetical protein
VTMVANPDSTLRPILGPGGESTSLVICISDSPISELFSKNAVFLDDIINDLLLVLVQPACDASNDDREWRKIREHLGILTFGEGLELLPCFQRIRASAPSEVVIATLLSRHRIPTHS